MTKKAAFFIFIFFFTSICNVNNLLSQNSFDNIPLVNVLFSPQDNCEAEIISKIEQANDYIYVAMYTFTSKQLAKALKKAKQRNVEIKICLDEEQSLNEHSKMNFLINSGMKTKIVNNNLGIMHHKFCVIDDYITITGSYNWTKSANDKNEENLLIINSKDIANAYKTQFNKYGSFDDDQTCTQEKATQSTEKKYVGTKTSKKFHNPTCRWAKKIKSRNQVWFNTRQEAINKGFIPCKVCRP